MYRNIMRYVDGIQDLPIYVMIFFFLFFVYAVYYIMTMRKDDVAKYSQIPLEDEPVEPINQEFKS